ncbi:hypothetical protein II1_03242 [Bacillus cereus MC118]|uniref:Uncharacterized protein n=1 Tax=Bacillus cereus MC67 TaxID=1053219 RepID=J8F0P7_BACCE|nr:hypothetical protein II3_01299 [Bacillus cereus MC67]EOP13383.1 hypothetical protein II1_03242 [Bacillus cereus MC118]
MALLYVYGLANRSQVHHSHNYVSCLEVSTGVLISPEGLNQRFNASAVQFLEQVLANLLNQRIHSTQEMLILIYEKLYYTTDTFWQPKIQ